MAAIAPSPSANRFSVAELARRVHHSLCSEQNYPQRNQIHHEKLVHPQAKPDDESDREQSRRLCPLLSALCLCVGASRRRHSRSSVVPSSMITTYSALASRLQNTSAGGAAISSRRSRDGDPPRRDLVEQDEVQRDVCREERERHALEHRDAGAEERECAGRQRRPRARL